MRRTPPGWRWPGEATAVLLLLVLPVLVYGVPALLGHPVLPGDDLTQNFPLRVLAGQEIRSGQLPLYDPYIWSGAPLLAGWNAGAAYPLTLLFAVVPPVAAWTLNMILTWAIAGLGMFAFLRALRLACVPSLLGALSFAFAGAMSAQVAHFGLVAGMSWVPVQLLCVLRLSQPRTMPSRLAWTGRPGRGVRPDDPRGRAAGHRRRRADRAPVRGLADRPPRAPLRAGRPSRSRPAWRWAPASGRFSGCPAWPSSARPSGASAPWPCSTRARCRTGGCC